MKSINLLDPAQQKTLEALTDDNNKNALSIIYGPPGTGKSHLITSLLFELALKGKKVLFVSQNTEALDVIVRMYEKLDKSMHKTKNDLCFLDFCLQLNNPACRKVKYLKEHKSTIMSQKVAPQYVNETFSGDDNNDTTPYKLSYRYLNEDINNNSDVLGIDELLVYQMKYMNDNATAENVIYSIEDVDVRMIFRLLGEYKYENSFQSLVCPDDQLKYVNRDNHSIGFNSLKSKSSELLENLFNLPKGYYLAKQDSDIVDYLSDLLSICRWQDFIDIKQIESKPEVIDEIIDAAKRLIQLRKKISDCEVIKITNDDFSFKKESISIIKNCNDLKEVVEVSSSAGEYSKQLKKYSKDFGINLDNYTPEQLLTHLLKAVGFKDNCNNIVQVAEGVNNYSAKEIERLIKDLAKWNDDLGFLKRKKTPTGTLGELTKSSKDTASFLFDNVDYLEHLVNLLSGTNLLVNDLLSISKKKIASSIYSPIESESDMSKDALEKLINLLAKIVERQWCEDCENISSTIEQLDDLSKYGSFVKENIELNKNKHFNSIEDALILIAKNINNSKSSRLISELEKEYSKYNSNPQNNFQTFCDTIVKTDVDRIKDVLERIENCSEPILIPYDRMLKLTNIINDMRSENGPNNIFNNEFFILAKGGNINNWLDRCNNIFAFNNINEFDSFVEHNNFIRRLKKMLGDERNVALIDQYLKMDISYKSFCNYLCRDIIGAKIGSMGAADRKSIDSSSFFKLYRNGNYIDRSRHYDRGLHSLKLKYEDPSRSLTDAINKTAGMHNIERYRKCSSKIIDAFPVIIATPSEVSKYLDAKRLFDYVVFDEASQLLPGQALPSLYRAERAIVVGDPHQMPPSLTTVIGFNDYDEDSDEEEFGQSILDMIKGLQTADEYHLTTHYRSESNQLFEPSRKAIYEEEGIQPIFEAKSNRMPIYISDNLGNDNEANFGKVIQRMRYYLAQEPNASFCLLFSRGDLMGLNAFRKYFDNNGANLRDIVQLYDENRLLISTIRDCQGIEGDHTILYLPQYRSIASMWFFNEKAGAYKRLNVAVTRQRKTLDIIMGDSRNSWLSECQRILNSPIGPNQERSAKLFMTLLSKAGQEINDEYLDKELSPNSNYIDSPLTKQLYEKLVGHYKDRIGEDLRIWCEVGYKLVIPSNDAMAQNHESVGYRIDIGIYSIKHRKFILGIEMDGSTYHSGFIKEFSDLQRQDILEMKGWNIYRIWSTNWIKDVNHEFSKLTDEIDNLLEEPVEDEIVVNEDTLIEAQAGTDHPGEDISGDESQDSKEENGSDGDDGQGKFTIVNKDIVGETQFITDFLRTCREAKKNGSAVRMKRNGAPEFEDLIIHDIAPDNSYILVKYELKSSFFKIKIDKIESFIMNDNSL